MQPKVSRHLQPRRLQKLRWSRLGNQLYVMWCTRSRRPLLEGDRACSGVRILLKYVQLRADDAGWDAVDLLTDALDLYLGETRARPGNARLDPLAQNPGRWVDRIVLAPPPWPEPAPGPDAIHASITRPLFEPGVDDVVGMGVMGARNNRCMDIY